MTQDYKDIDGYWGVLFVYGYDIDKDYDIIEDILYSFGLDTPAVRKSMRILAEPNTGMAVTQSTLKMSVVFLGCTTSRGQWYDTIMHEIDHVQSAICDYYGVMQGSEEAAYLQGYLARVAAPIIEDVCPMCGLNYKNC